MNDSLNRNQRRMRAQSLRHATCASLLRDFDPGDLMEHTHEFDCIICGAHLDSEQELDRHNKEKHTPRVAANVERADPIGNEESRKEEPDDRMT
jgi:hypothetical protein